MTKNFGLDTRRNHRDAIPIPWTSSAAGTLLDFQGKLNLPVSQFPIGSGTILYCLSFFTERSLIVCHLFENDHLSSAQSLRGNSE
jgi:hypothetical protein